MRLFISCMGLQMRKSRSWKGIELRDYQSVIVDFRLIYRWSGFDVIFDVED
jgi:hypothetical protein